MGERNRSNENDTQDSRQDMKDTVEHCQPDHLHPRQPPCTPRPEHRVGKSDRNGPPFNAKRSFNAPLGSKAAGQRFDDRWKWDDVTTVWLDLLATDNEVVKEVVEAAAVIEGGTVDRRTGKIDTGRVTNSMAAYLAYMAPRIIEMRRVLAPNGSIYVHCDDAVDSYLRLLMDAVFGRAAFRTGRPVEQPHRVTGRKERVVKTTAGGAWTPPERSTGVPDIVTCRMCLRSWESVGVRASDGTRFEERGWDDRAMSAVRWRRTNCDGRD